MPNSGQATPVVPGTKDTDPTALTREMIARETAHLRDVIDGVRESVTTRLDAMDKAIELLQTYPTEVDRKVGQLQELTEEKFRSVDMRFQSSATALEMALANTKEASAKTETNFTKQLDSTGAVIASEKNAVSGQISDIKDRLTTIESVKRGAGESWGVMLAAITATAAVVGIVSFLVAQ